MSRAHHWKYLHSIQKDWGVRKQSLNNQRTERGHQHGSSLLFGLRQAIPFWHDSATVIIKGRYHARITGSTCTVPRKIVAYGSNTCSQRTRTSSAWLLGVVFVETRYDSAKASITHASLEVLTQHPERFWRKEAKLERPTNREKPSAWFLRFGFVLTWFSKGFH